MNFHTFTNLSVLAMIAAFLVVPLSVKAAVIAFMMTGIVAVILADYSRDLRSLRVRAELIPFEGRGKAAQFDEAA
jgi:hypothetical protein